MKRIFILHILFLFMIGLNAQAYEAQTHLKRFGYTTSVGRPVNYNSNVNTQHGHKYGHTTINYGYQTMQYNNNAIYSGTYNPATSSGGNGGPRKVKGYTNDGEYHDDGNPSVFDPWYAKAEYFDENMGNYEYFWYGNHWWRRSSSGNWEIWTSWAGWHSSWGILYDSHPDETAQFGYNTKKPPYPDDPNPTPLNSDLSILLILLIFYAWYIQGKRKSANV